MNKVIVSIKRKSDPVVIQHLIHEAAGNKKNFALQDKKNFVLEDVYAAGKKSTREWRPYFSKTKVSVFKVFAKFVESTLPNVCIPTIYELLKFE